MPLTESGGSLGELSGEVSFETWEGPYGCEEVGNKHPGLGWFGELQGINMGSKANYPKNP